MARSKGHLKWPDDGPNHFSIFAFLTTFSQKNDKKGPREEKNSISWKSAFEIGAKFEKENMKLFSSFPRRLIDDDSMTLADLNLFPNGVIHVV